MDREGEIGLVAVAFAQMPVHAVEAFPVILERPAGARLEDRPVGGSGRERRLIAVRRAVEDAEAGKRRAAAFRQKRRELRLQQITRLVGKIAGKPFAGMSRGFGGFERGEEIGRRFGCKNFFGRLEQEFAPGSVVAEKGEG